MPRRAPDLVPLPIRAVSLPVENIRTMCVEAKIRQSVVGAVTVIVACLEAGRARPDESQQNQPVDRPGPALA
jgi:hypothetical protein